MSSATDIYTLTALERCVRYIRNNCDSPTGIETAEMADTELAALRTAAAKWERVEKLLWELSHTSGYPKGTIGNDAYKLTIERLERIGREVVDAESP